MIRFDHIDPGDLAIIFIDSAKIAIVMFSESFLFAKKMARTNGDQLNANHELMTYGITNIISSFLGCYPIYGSFVRSKLLSIVGTNSQFFSFIGSFFCLFACIKYLDRCIWLYIYQNDPYTSNCWFDFFLMCS